MTIIGRRTGRADLPRAADRPSTYFRRKAEQRDPTRRSARAVRDEVLRAIIRRIYEDNHRVYLPPQSLEANGTRRYARGALPRAAVDAGDGLVGASRGRAWTTTIHSAPAVDRPRNLVDRHFTARRPNQLWVADFTYVATWRGFGYVAFVVDVFARRIVGWRISSSLTTDFVLDALE